MGMMRVNMRIHGGNQGFLDAMDGLVVRNERAVRAGVVPAPKQTSVRFHAEPLWRDAPTALRDGVASAGTMAAWLAAVERVEGRPANLAMVDGIPVVYRPTADEVGLCSRISPPSSVPLGIPARSPLLDGPGGIVANVAGRQWPAQDGSRSRAWWNFGASAFSNPFGMSLTPGATHRNGTLLLPYSGEIPRKDLCGALSNERGRVSEWLLLSIDDDDGLPIREIGNSIAHHNAKQIRASIGSSGTDAWTKEIPDLYQSGVRYEVEGLPEIWKDSREILIDGFDDCEGLAAFESGQLMARHGIPAEVWTRQIHAPTNFPGGVPTSRMFHAVTRAKLGEGKYAYSDPSVRLGMECPLWYWEYAKERRAKGLDL